MHHETVHDTINASLRDVNLKTKGDKITVIDQSEAKVLVPIKLAIGGAAIAEGAAQVEAVPVIVEAHECEGGAATCEHRGFTMTSKESGAVIFDSQLEDEGEAQE